jgi:hypothetical protein
MLIYLMLGVFKTVSQNWVTAMDSYTPDQPALQIFPTIASMLLFAFASWMIPKMAGSIASGSLGLGGADVVNAGAAAATGAALAVATVASGGALAAGGMAAAGAGGIEALGAVGGDAAVGASSSMASGAMDRMLVRSEDTRCHRGFRPLAMSEKMLFVQKCPFQYVADQAINLPTFFYHYWHVHFNSVRRCRGLLFDRN